jgi:hypothetical protein
MWSAAAVLVCALDILGRSPATLPPIMLLDTPLRGVSPGIEAFVPVDGDTIYLMTSSAVFRAAQESRLPCGALGALRKIASIIVHEEWHVRNGADERGAYEAQLTALAAMGSGAGSPVYAEVSRSMRAVTISRRPPVVATSRAVPLAARSAPRPGSGHAALRR